MRHCRFLIFVLIALLALAACHRNQLPQRDRLAEKTEPYDFFAFQRSYPDPHFDWNTWRQALRHAREADVAVADRSGCGSSNPTAWTLQGPSNVAGRVNTLAVKPDNEDVVLAGFASGGIFKSTDGAATWRPVFEDNLELAIGDIAFDPQNPNVVYAGTGDANMPSQVFNGHGIYKSTDAGETWAYLGLGEQGIVSHIVVHPTDSQILYAAVNGNPFVRNDQRGIFKTTDGGKTWQRIHFVSNQAGASDLVMNTQNPQVLYASYWDRIRSNTESVIYGPNAKVFKTTDGGATWTQLGGGLPTGKMGRTGLAISQQNPDKVYAIFVDTLSTLGGLYKTVNGGQSWTLMNGVPNNYGGFGWYFGKIDLNPTNDEDVFFHGILLWRKPPANTGWSVASGGHSDSHDLVWTPSGRRYWANDGGVYRNNPGSMTWTKSINLPATQLYHTTYNHHQPGTYYAGAQDNGILRGSNINLNNWQAIFPADGFNCAFHPTEPQQFWIEIQNGAIHYTTDGGSNWKQGPACLGTGDRCNWDTPFFISQHPPHLLYAATYRVYASSDGTGWGVTSGDITDGVLTEPRFHTVSCLGESPLLAGKLIAGTTDGNVWWRTPAGAWTDVTAGLPNRYVTSVHGSPTAPNRLYVTHSGIKYNEEIPHVHRSDNNGQTWVNISGNLPQVPVNDLFVLPGHADSVLFAGTDVGTYFTLDAGKNWSRLGKGLPYVAVFDLVHNPGRKQLQAATFGRGLWTFPLDSVFVQSNTAVVTSVGGDVNTEEGTGVGGVRLLSGQPPMLSDTSGQYLLGSVPGCQTLEIAPYLDKAPLNGVSTYDLVIISKHILGLEPIASPYRLIAADANRSGSVTTFDIVQIRRLILGIDTVFANNTSWRFVPKNYTFPDPTNPFKAPFPEKLELPLQASPVSGADFVGIKIGDLNATALPNFSPQAEDRTGGTLVFEVTADDMDGDRFVSAGETLDLSFRPVAAALGYQMTLELDGLAVAEVLPSASVSVDNFGVFRSAEGEAMTVSVENPGGFRARFRATKTGLLSEMLRLSDRITRSEAYFQHYSRSQRISKLALKFPSAPHFELLQNAPNPMGSDGTQVSFRLPEASDAVLTLRNAEGRVLKTLRGFFPKGLNTLTLTRSDLGVASGVVFYQLDTPKHSAARKMVVGE